MPCAENREKREGSCLMKTPELVGKIVRSLVESQKKPVTIKFRKGFDEEHINAVEIAKIAEAKRLRPRWQCMAEPESSITAARRIGILSERSRRRCRFPSLVTAISFTPQDAKNLLEHTGCDAIMVGRGAQGNPWIFKRIRIISNGGASARTDRTGARREGPAPFSDADCL